MNYDDMVKLVNEFQSVCITEGMAAAEDMNMGDYKDEKTRLLDAIQELQRDADMLEAVLRDAGITIKRGPHGITWEWQSNSFGKAMDEAMQQEQGRGTG